MKQAELTQIGNMCLDKTGLTLKQVTIDGLLNRFDDLISLLKTVPSKSKLFSIISTPIWFPLNKETDLEIESNLTDFSKKYTKEHINHHHTNYPNQIEWIRGHIEHDADFNEVTINIGKFNLHLWLHENIAFVPKLLISHNKKTMKLSDSNDFITALNWAIDLFTNHFDQIKNCKTDYYQNRKVPNAFLAKKIAFSDYVKYDKEKQSIFTNLKRTDKELFINIAGILQSPQTEGIPLTRSLYINIVRKCLRKLMVFERYSSAEFAYKNFSANDEQGLFEIEDTPEAFIEWHKQTINDAPFNILKTHKYSNSLYIIPVLKDDKFTLLIETNGFTPSTANAIKVAIYLYTEKIPFRLEQALTYKKALSEKAFIQVNPINKLFSPEKTKAGHLISDISAEQANKLKISGHALIESPLEEIW